MDIASPTGRVSAWPDSFGIALQSGDTEALKSLCAEECYWRDLVSFTWNIKTMEGRDAIADMVLATLSGVHPTNWQIDGEPSEAGGITEAWITFETDAVHGRGHERLEKAGFQLDWGADRSGLFMKYLRRGSGYCIDVGASELVADGKIKLANGQVSEVTPGGVKLEDGTELAADAIVFATGYSSMNGWAELLIGRDVADRVGKCWGLGSDTPKDPGPWEGELRNMWKSTQQEALWFHGGNLHQSRHYSKFLSIQLKARMEGVPTPVYGLQEAQHTAQFRCEVVLAERIATMAINSCVPLMLGWLWSMPSAMTAGAY